MGLFSRLKMGLVLTKDSLLVMRHHPRLFLFPIVSAIAGFAFLALFLGITFGLMAVSPEGGALVGLFLVYLALTFVSSFFTAGLVHQTREALSGNEVSLRDGIDAAWEVKVPILVWSLVAATVGVILNAIQSSDSRIGRLLGSLFGLAWTVMTFFVIPSIVFERASATGMFRQSASTFKSTWGETPISLAGVQVVSLLVLVPFALVAFALFSTQLVLGAIAVFLLGVLVSFLISQTLQGVLKTTLYLYAKEGKRPDEFDDVDFDDLADDSGRQPARGTPTSGGFH